MNTAQISAFFEKNKIPVLGVAGVGVVGLALSQRKKGDSGGGNGAAVAGALPAAAVVPSQTGPGYTSGSYDTYNALQPTLEAILQQGNQQTNSRSGITAAPAPVASSLFAPSWTNNLVRGGDGAIAEVQSDGSLFLLSGAQFAAATERARQAGGVQVNQLGGNLPASFSTESNLGSIAKRQSGV